MAIVATIDQAGIAAPDYTDILDSLAGRARAVYGADLYLDPDSQDGAFLAIFALALADVNAMAIAVYNNFSPATGQGEGLSRTVKINGLARKVPSYSTVDFLIAGQVGTTIVNGSVTDAAGGRWYLNADVTIPPSGQATASATYQSPGAMIAPAGSLTTIGSPTRGWQSVTNPAAATPGQPVEADADLRIRQAVSTALPSRSVFDGIVGALLSLPGVIRLRGYENDTSATDGNGIPGHTISFVVDGGDAQAIANTIGAKKGPGTGTYGTTALTVIDVYAIPRAIQFYRPSFVAVQVSIALTALPGYSTSTGAAIQAAVAAYIAALPIATPIRLSRLYVPIDFQASTFNVTGITIGRNGGAQAAADLLLAFNEASTCVASDVVLTVTA